MQRFGTSLGVVPVWGDLSQFSDERRLLVVIRGAFPERDNLLGLAEALPHIDVAFLHLPGMHSPFLAESTVRAFGIAYAEVLGQVFPGRQINLLGVSMGGLAAMAIRGLPVRSIIALDTPLTTDGLWPLESSLLKHAALSPQLANWIWQIFGLSQRATEVRDYRDLLADLNVPTRVLLGDEPLLPARQVNRLPSLVSERDRVAYLAHPSIGTTLVGGAGHNIPRDGQAAMMATLYRWLGAPPIPTE